MVVGKHTVALPPGDLPRDTLVGEHAHAFRHRRKAEARAPGCFVERENRALAQGVEDP